MLAHEPGVGQAGGDRPGAEPFGDGVFPSLAVAQQIEPGQRDELDRARRPAGLGDGLVQLTPDELDHVRLRAQAVDDGVGQRGRGLQAPGTAGRHPDRDVADVVPEAVGVQEFDLGLLAVPAVRDTLPAQQGPDHLHRVDELLDGRRPVPHGPQGVVRGADPQEGPARREHVQGGDRVGGHRGDPGQRVGDHRAQVDRRRLLRRQRHLLVRIGEQQRALAHPEVGHAEVLGLLDQVDLVDLGARADTEIHLIAPFAPGLAAESVVPVSPRPAGQW